MKTLLKFILAQVLLLTTSLPCGSWGFYAHKEINRLAVFTLPPEMFSFYKSHIHYLSDNAVNPDKRRYAVKEEACRHFIDLDAYPDSLRKNMPKYWHAAKSAYAEDSLIKHGIVPWHVYLMKVRLTDAFKVSNVSQVLRLSSEIGHYIGDAHVPLHTTRNYNGQFTNQQGIHGFWESRLPELYSKNYDFFVGRAVYLNDVQQAIWNGIYQAHAALDSVLKFEERLNEKWPEDRKYSIEERNGANIKVYSEEYSRKYHELLAGQVERQMTASVKLLGDVWYTCWVDAGQPELSVHYDHQPAVDTTISKVTSFAEEHKDCHR